MWRRDREKLVIVEDRKIMQFDGEDTENRLLILRHLESISYMFTELRRICTKHGKGWSCQYVLNVLL